MNRSPGVRRLGPIHSVLLAVGLGVLGCDLLSGESDKRDDGAGDAGAAGRAGSAGEGLFGSGGGGLSGSAGETGTAGGGVGDDAGASGAAGTSVGPGAAGAVGFGTSGGTGRSGAPGTGGSAPSGGAPGFGGSGRGGSGSSGVAGASVGGALGSAGSPDATGGAAAAGGAEAQSGGAAGIGGSPWLRGGSAGAEGPGGGAGGIVIPGGDAGQNGGGFAGAGGNSGSAGSSNASGEGGVAGSAGGGPEVVEPDEDGDRISDADEGRGELRDSDGDDVPDYLDEDSDEDGILDADEAGDSGYGTPPVDSDSDGVADYLDEDSDEDGIPDADEAGDADLDTPPVESDGDGAPDCRDGDSDGDGYSDAVEAGDSNPSTPPVDTDGDGTPDYLDEDSDDDNVSDAVERVRGMNPLDRDSDDDTIRDDDDGIWNAEGTGPINALDTDSDDDGIPDAVEAGDTSLETPPVDSDDDGLSDFRDLDSDNDSIPDAAEIDCGAIGHSGASPDVDGDGYSDLAELAAAGFQGLEPATLVCDPEVGMLDAGLEFFFVLPYGESAQQDVLRFVPTVKQADVFFNVDTTGSMWEETTQLRTSLGDIIDDTQARVTSAAFGVGHFEDFPCGYFGSTGDSPFELLQGVTTDTALATSGVEGLPSGSGADGPESGYEALYQIAAGTGISGGYCLDIPAYSATGTLGGGRFRPGSLPIVMHITDATSHPSTDYPAEYLPHSEAQALSALQGIGARVITVQSDGGYSDALTQLQAISDTTRAVVPVCAFNSESGWRCGENTCCNGTIADGDDCILRYSINSDGTGLGDVTVDGIDAIVKYTTFDVYSVTRDDGDVATPATDALIQSVVAINPETPPTLCVGRADGCDFRPALEPERSCNPTPTPGDVTGAGFDNGFYGFAVGSSSELRQGAKLYFTVSARNTTVPATFETQSFLTNIDIIDYTTGAVLDTQQAFIIVPPIPPG